MLIFPKNNKTKNAKKRNVNIF